MIDAGRLVNERFFAVAGRFSSHPALAFCNASVWEEWSYQKLANRARSLASRLNSIGIGHGDAVGIISSRYPDTIAAMIAILDLGAYYVPLDPSYPETRLRLLCDSAGVSEIFSAVPISPARCFPKAVHVLDSVDDTQGKPLEVEAGRIRLAPEAPAYIMFTSGSTGEPKGVIVPHRAIVRLIDKPNFMLLDASRIFLQLAPLGFDASTLEVWGPLLNGGTCVLYPDSQLPTTSGLRAVISDTGVNSIWLTASLFNAIVDQDLQSLAGLEEILTGGEALSVPHVCKALAGLVGTRFINGYGPTENTTFTVCYRIPPEFSDGEPRVPIGMPISGTDIAIVDQHLRPVPVGTEGELIALGEGVALGYVNDPSLTQERFIEITGKNGVAARGYRTGDRVVERRDGLIDFLGRYDDQVKIDGYRIEPGEIERVIAGMKGIRECRVLVHSGPAGQKRIAAYVVAINPESSQNLKHRLGEVLPAFMVPHFLYVVDALPINLNGKLDKSALPDPFRQAPDMKIGMRVPELVMVADAWKQILGQSPSSEDVNFFDAGGTSLEAVRLHGLLCERFARSLDSTFVFEFTTITRQAEALRSSGRDDQRVGGRGQQRRNAPVRLARGIR